MTTERPKEIQTIEDLRLYLKDAMSIEHSTIPPYMTALYSLKPGTNLEAFHIIRQVAVEEMLHLTLAANVFNAVGGDFNEGVLTDKDFVPEYPTGLLTGPAEEDYFEVNLSKFSEDTVKTFRLIERSKHVDQDEPIVTPRGRRYLLKTLESDEASQFYSIGLFYAEIIRGMYTLHRKMGNTLFCGDPKKQITPEYYYSGGGDIIPVTDLNSAIRALKVIQEQGEGTRHDTIYDAERELGHDFRFQQLQLGQYYVVNKDDPESSDMPDCPTGEKFTVDWNAVYPIKENAQLSDYPEGSEMYAAALEFQKGYSDFLARIENAFNGNPQELIPAVGDMFRLKELATQLIRNPIPGNQEGENGAPLHGAPIFRL